MILTVTFYIPEPAQFPLPGRPHFSYVKPNNTANKFIIGMTYKHDITSLFFALFLITACSSVNQTEQQQETDPSEPAELFIDGASAHWVSSDRLIWDAGSEAEFFELYYSRDAGIEITESGVSRGESIVLTPGSELTNDLADKFRHISHRPVFSLSEDRDQIHNALKGQLVAVAKDDVGRPIKATKVQTHGVIDDLYIYDGDLGPVYSEDSISLSLWAPTAQSVTLRLYDDEKNLAEEIDPSDSSPQDGVWRFDGPAGWDRMFYRFDVRFTITKRVRFTISRLPIPTRSAWLPIANIASLWM